VPEGLKVELWAAEPKLANPVAFCLDNRGRMYVCETFRQSRGIEDNRGHAHWLDDDLAAQTVEDRLAYIKKHLGERAMDYTKHDDRVRLLEDTTATAGRTKRPCLPTASTTSWTAPAAGVLAHRGNVLSHLHPAPVALARRPMATGRPRCGNRFRTATACGSPSAATTCTA
jgi:quinoprotein glucose dehydrogenase